MKEVILKPIFHREAHCVKIAIGPDAELHACLKTLAGCRWSKTHGGWYVEKRDTLLRELLACFKGKAFINYTALKSEIMPALDKRYENDIIQILTAPVKAGRTLVS